MTKVALDTRLYDALCAAGLADNNTRRIVLDIKPPGPHAVVYIEKWGDDRVLQVVTALEGVEIKRVEEEVGDRG